MAIDYIKTRWILKSLVSGMTGLDSAIPLACCELLASPLEDEWRQHRPLPLPI